MPSMVGPCLPHLSHLLTSLRSAAVLCPLPFGSCEASASGSLGPLPNTWDSANGCSKRSCCHRHSQHPETSGASFSAPPSIQGPSRSPRGDPTTTRHHTLMTRTCVCGMVLPPPETNLEPTSTSPAQGRLQDPEVTVHPSLWPTLTSPLLEVRWVARTESFQDLPFVPPSPPPSLTQACPGQRPTACLLSTGSWGACEHLHLVMYPCVSPSTPHPHAAPRASLWLRPTQSEGQSPPDLQGPTQVQPCHL